MNARANCILGCVGRRILKRGKGSPRSILRLFELCFPTNLFTVPRLRTSIVAISAVNSSQFFDTISTSAHQIFSFPVLSFTDHTTQHFRSILISLPISYFPFSAAFPSGHARFRWSVMSGHGARNFERHEDALLLELVKTYGTDAWGTIASNFTNRTPRQCRNRYTLFLAPSIRTDPWTPEEDELLKRQYDAIGPKWAVLRQYFPGRTDLNIKNRFVFLSRNYADVKRMKARFAGEGGKGKKNQEDGGSNFVTFDSLFQSLPYYMNRCALLEALLDGHGLAVPPKGVCDDWAIPGRDGPPDGDAVPSGDDPEKQ
jgi:hypothetical protein